MMKRQGKPGPERRLAVMCAWCHEVRDEGGRWRPADPRELRQPQSPFSHGICPRCFQREAVALGIDD